MRIVLVNCLALIRNLACFRYHVCVCVCTSVPCIYYACLNLDLSLANVLGWRVYRLSSRLPVCLVHISILYIIYEYTYDDSTLYVASTHDTCALCWYERDLILCCVFFLFTLSCCWCCVGCTMGWCARVFHVYIACSRTRASYV